VVPQVFGHQLTELNFWLSKPGAHKHYRLGYCPSCSDDCFIRVFYMSEHSNRVRLCTWWGYICIMYTNALRDKELNRYLSIMTNHLAHKRHCKEIVSCDFFKYLIQSIHICLKIYQYLYNCLCLQSI